MMIYFAEKCHQTTLTKNYLHLDVCQTNSVMLEYPRPDSTNNYEA